MSFVSRLGAAALLVLAAIACLALGTLSLGLPDDKVGRASRLFFCLAAGAAAFAFGVIVL